MAMWADRTNILVVGHEVMERLVTIAGWCGGLRNWLKCLGRVSYVIVVWVLATVESKTLVSSIRILGHS
jgi:hypothetical protein